MTGVLRVSVSESLERETKAHREKYSQPQVFFPPPHTPCIQ